MTPPVSQVVCVDFGSTFTKAALVDLGSGSIVAAASHRNLGAAYAAGYRRSAPPPSRTAPLVPWSTPRCC